MRTGERIEALKLYGFKDGEKLTEDERDAAMALIAAHNAECERLCHRDVKGGRCEAYVSRGRECTDCPRDWMIDARALLGDGGEA